MAGRPGKKAQAQPQPQPAAKPFDEFADDAEGFDDEVPAVDAKGNPIPAGAKARDWRDVEKYREQRELRRLIGDGIDDLDDRPGRRRK